MQSSSVNSREQEASSARPQMVGEEQHPDKMQGHWVLARAGKRVLRPGGLELTRQMLDALAINSQDRVVEFAPGLGVTARMVLQKRVLLATVAMFIRNLVLLALFAPTSAALLVTYALGVLVGLGHTFTPVAAAILMTLLLVPSRSVSLPIAGAISPFHD